MRIPRVYLPVPLQVGFSVPLAEAAVHHVIRVLRLAPGAALVVFNGQGGEFHGVLTEARRRAARIDITGFIAREVESPLPVLLAQGVSKSERMDFTIQKAVELGVAGIVPVLVQRSVVHLGEERLVKRLQRWRGVIAAACEQCGRNRLPALMEPVCLSDWLSQDRRTGQGLVLHPDAQHRLNAVARPAGPVHLLIGPEGGLSPAEITAAEAAGFISIQLGPRIMRTETAGLATLAALQALWGDLG